MNNILSSATKIVLLIFAVTVALTYTYSIVTGKIVVDGKDFSSALMLVLGFYFAYKGDTNTPPTTPYAGK